MLKSEPRLVKYRRILWAEGFLTSVLVVAIVYFALNLTGTIKHREKFHKEKEASEAKASEKASK